MNKENEFNIICQKINDLEEKLTRKKRKRHRSHSKRRRRDRSNRSRSRHRTRSPTPRRRRRRENRSRSRSGSLDIVEVGPPPIHETSSLNPQDDQTCNVGVLEEAPMEAMDTVSNSVEVSPPSAAAQQMTASPELLQLDPEIINILGAAPEDNEKFGKEIFNDVAVRLEHIAQNGLSRDERKSLIEKYLIPNNCKLVRAPALNNEIKAAISEVVLKRDKAIESRQRQTGAAITGLGNAMSLIINENKDPGLLQILMDVSRIICDTQHNDTVTRKNFILSTLKKDLKDQIMSTKSDDFLFGSNFSETLKTAKTITKSAAELRNITATAKFIIAATRPLNSKGPYPPPQQHQTAAAMTRRTQPGQNQRTRKTVQTRPQQQSSYKTSQPQRGPYSQNRR